MMIDGKGPPGNDTYIATLGWLYPVSYGIKFRSKLEMEQDYVVPPLGGALVGRGLFSLYIRS